MFSKTKDEEEKDEEETEKETEKETEPETEDESEGEEKKNKLTPLELKKLRREEAKKRKNR